MTDTVTTTALSKWFGPKVAVSEVTIGFGPGVTGLLGPNGAGKTTLMRVVAGLQRPSQGEVSVLGENPRKTPTIYEEDGPGTRGRGDLRETHRPSVHHPRCPVGAGL